MENKNKVLLKNITFKIMINTKSVAIYKSMLNNEWQVYQEDTGLNQDELTELSKFIDKIKEVDDVLGR